MGREAVGSMVTFFSGRPQKDEYRRFRIKSVTQIDDYAMIREIIRRRYKRVLLENLRLPDLILIDGGRGHLNTARDELNKVGPLNIPVVSIAKSRPFGGKPTNVSFPPKGRGECIYTEKDQEPLRFSKTEPALKLIMKIRDEAHRFAISYHKLLRGKDLLHSALDEIEGVGEKRKKVLINHFGSVGYIKKAELKDLKSVKGLDEKTAKKIIQHFKKR